MPARIVVIAEATADFRHASGLIDRKILHHAPEWFDDAQLQIERQWCGIEPGSPFTCWKDINRLAKTHDGLRGRGPLGFGQGDSFRFDYSPTRKALQMCALMTPRPNAVLLVRDLDNQPRERRVSIEQARKDMNLGNMEVVLALAEAKREAWVLNGFDPRTRAEERKLASLRRELGFDPRAQANQLDAVKHGAKRDAKRVLAGLTAGDATREEACWLETDWTILRQRGTASGLSAFLTDAKDRLVPLITGERVTE